MAHLSNCILSNIFFENEVDRSETKDLHATLPAPTILTGQSLRGSLIISHYGIREHYFDTVQLVLKGIEPELNANIFPANRSSRESKESN
jgi:hypothetical protein